MLRPLLYQTFFTLGKREVSRFDRDAATPEATQSRHLLEIIERNAASAFGKKHGFSSIQSVRDFQNAVAINDYDSLSEYINRAADGEKGQLTVEDPFMFATTSGTAGERKMIPVTRSYIKEFRRASVVSGFNLLKSHPNLTKGIALSVFSPADRKTPRPWSSTKSTRDRAKCSAHQTDQIPANERVRGHAEDWV